MSDKELKIEIKVDTTGQEGAKAAKEEIKAVVDESQRYQAALQAMASKEEAAKDGTTELNASVREYAEAVKSAKAEMESGGGAFVPENLKGKLEDAAHAMDAEGDSAGRAGPKHLMIRRLMGELDRISPGLGESMHLVAEAYMTAGESAEGGAVGVAAFTAALDELLVTLGPLLIAMLSIQAVMEYWDLYKEHVNAAAEAQSAAMKRIEESTKGALKAVQELDEAMHPKKHDKAEQDEAALKRNEQNLDNTYKRQKAVNSAEEARQTSAASSPAEKEQIKEQFADLDRQLEEWRAKQKAAIEGSMVDTMQKQLDDIKAEEDKLVAKAKLEYQQGLLTGDMSQYDKTKVRLQQNADEAKPIREKLDELTAQQQTDATNANYDAATNRQVAGIDYRTRTQKDARAALTKDKGTADALLAGKSVSSDAALRMQQDANKIAGHGVTMAQAAKIIEDGAKNMGTLMSGVNRLANAMAHLSPQDLSALERRIDAIEAQNASSGNRTSQG